MATLNRKLWRDLAASKTQSLAIALVVASGVAVFVMSLGTLAFLRSTRDSYYERYRFADVFASLRRAPESVAEEIMGIPGVSRIQSRIVSDVTLDVPGLNEPAVGRLISIPDDALPALNNVFLREGRLPNPDRPGEVLVNEVFAEANRLQLGDHIDAVLQGRFQRLRIVGIGLSPEYVFQMRLGDLLPDERRFGVLWLRRRQMESAFDMRGAFNDVTVALMRGANPDAVIRDLDRLLKPYGGVGAYDRNDQISARFLDDEIKQLRATAVVSPAIFLGVAAFLLNVVLSRRIQTQREVIATLKAFGYGNREVALHYLQGALVVTAAGAAIGVVAGHWMGSSMAELYGEFYRFPETAYHPDPRGMVLAVTVSLAAATLGVLRSVMKVLRMSPAEAMRPASPAVYHRTWWEQLWLFRLLPVTVKMNVRHVRRKPLHAMFAVLGIAFSVSILVMGHFLTDAFDHLIDHQFYRAQRHDVQVAMYQVTSPGGEHELNHLPGVQRVEPYRAVAAQLRHGHRSYRTAILGLDHERELYQLLDASGARIPLPEGGIVLSDKLAQSIGVVPGDTISIEVMEGRQPIEPVRVAGTAMEFAGMNAYMSRRALSRLMQESEAISGVYLTVDEAFQDELYRTLKQTPRVASVSVKRASIEQFHETVTNNQLAMQQFTTFFAVIIAIGVIYNTARISLEERSRELATLRVIGFTRAEVATILLGELAVTTCVAIPIGSLFGYGFCFAMVKGFESEAFRIPLVIESSSYASAALVTIAAAMASGLAVRRRLDRLDLVEVLKTRE